MTHLRRITLVRFLLLGGAAAGCSTASALDPDAAIAAVDAEVVAPSLIGLEVSPPALGLGIGDAQAVAVTGVFDDGSTRALTGGLAWTSSDPPVATVSDAGVVTAVAAGAATIEVSSAGHRAEVEVTVTGPVLRVFADDYGAGITFAPFGGSSNGPSIIGAEPHGGTTSLRLEVPAAGYTGGAFASATPVDLSGFSVVTFWARASRAATLNVVGLGNDAVSNLHWAEWNAVPLTTTWTRHVVPLPDAARLTAERGLFHVAEGSEEGAYTLWLDDIQYEVDPAVALGVPSPAIATETVSRPVGDTFLINGASVTYLVGGVSRTIATARSYFTFTSSQPSVATVDAEGRVTAVAAGSTTITAQLGAIAALGALTFNVQP